MVRVHVDVPVGRGVDGIHEGDAYAAQVEAVIHSLRRVLFDHLNVGHEDEPVRVEREHDVPGERGTDLVFIVVRIEDYDRAVRRWQSMCW